MSNEEFFGGIFVGVVIAGAISVLIGLGISADNQQVIYSACQQIGGEMLNESTCVDPNGKVLVNFDKPVDR